MGRVGGQVLQFLGINRQIKQLGRVVHIVAILEAAVPQQGGATRAADGVVLRQHRAVGGGPLRQVSQRLPAGLRQRRRCGRLQDRDGTVHVANRLCHHLPGRDARPCQNHGHTGGFFVQR